MRGTASWQVAALCLTLVCGCVPVPLSAPRDVPIPEFHSQLPADVRASRAGVLVLTQVQRVNRGDKGQALSVYDLLYAHFTRGSDLPALRERLALRSTRRIALLTIAGGTVLHTTEILEQLCVVTADGRTFGFSSPGDKGWEAFAQDRLDVARGKAFIAAIRNGAKYNYVSGPCGIRGAADWPYHDIGDVESFLRQLPAGF